MRDTPADLISVKIGINVVNSDLMRLRAFTPAVHGFLDTLREGHPGTPLLVVSSLLCPIHEDTPGPSLPDPEAFEDGRLRFLAMGDPAERAAGKLTLRGIREELSRVVRSRAADDPNLYYLDGLELYGEARTPSSCRCPTSYTRTRPPTAASANASPRRCSRTAARSPPRPRERPRRAPAARFFHLPSGGAARLPGLRVLPRRGPGRAGAAADAGMGGGRG